MGGLVFLEPFQKFFVIQNICEHYLYPRDQFLKIYYRQFMLTINQLCRKSSTRKKNFSNVKSLPLRVLHSGKEFVLKFLLEVQKNQIRLCVKLLNLSFLQKKS